MKFKAGEMIEKFTVNKNGKKVEVIFRFPELSDAKGAMISINKLVNENALIGAVKKKNMKQEKDWIKKLMQEIKNKNSFCIFVEINGKYIGSCQLKRKPIEATNHIAVIGISLDRDYRKLGIGERLMKTSMNLAKKHMNIEIIWLDYFKGNPAAKLYIKLGFKECGWFPKMRKKGKIYHDGIIMYKFLK